MQTPYTIHNISQYLQQRLYPGRGIVTGLSPDGKFAVSAYFIMARSENSRNRVFEPTAGGLRTRAFDESKLTDPSLVIYNAMESMGRALIVTNGDQTDTIVEEIHTGEGGFESALKTREFEPDPPIFTPRISSITKFYKSDPLKYKLSILKATDSDGTTCSRHFFNYTALQGVGHFIHTYSHDDGTRVYPFEGEPLMIATTDSIDEFANSIWDSLNEDNKVSLWVRYTDIATLEAVDRIANKNG